MTQDQLQVLTAKLTTVRDCSFDPNAREYAADLLRMLSPPPEDGTDEHFVWTPGSLQAEQSMDLTVTIPCACGVTHEVYLGEWDGAPARRLLSCGRLLEFSAGLTVEARIVRMTS